MSSSTSSLTGVELSALTDPVRRRLFEFVTAEGSPVRRDAAAAAAGISRSLAAYHLDRLVDAGLLATSYARPEGVGGPGAGRPAKLYEPVRGEVSITIPPRSYDVLANVLATVLANAVATDPTGNVQAALLSAAEAEGRHAGSSAEDLVDTLRARGYEPELVGQEIGLANCPFHQLVQRHTGLVCGLNHALLRGLLAARGDDPDDARLTPRPGHCCVTINRPCDGRSATVDEAG